MPARCALLSVVLLVVSLVGCDSDRGAPGRPVESPDLAALAERYRIEVVVADRPADVPVTGGVIHADPPDPLEVAGYTPALAAELGRYPPALVRWSGLRRLVLCRRLAYNADPVEGLPDLGRADLYLDIAPVPYDPGYARRVIHHEFFHLLDYRAGRFEADPEWEALNPPGFRYGPGGWQARRDPSSGVLTDRHPGFLTAYATAAMCEDKAEVFSYLMTDPAGVAARARVDPVVRAKVARLKATLADRCPATVAEFWARSGEAGVEAGAGSAAESGVVPDRYPAGR